MKIAIIFLVLLSITSCSGFLKNIVDAVLCIGQVFTSTKDKVAQGTTFKLYTRNNRNEAFAYKMGITAILGSFNANRKNIFICHGFTQNGDLPWVMDMKNALLDREDVNVWAVDWAPLAAGAYPIVVGNVRHVGMRLAEFIEFLGKQGSSLDRCHMIGHSLGAHVVGYAGEELKGKVARISALDAAGPLFEPSLTKCRIDKSDAVFVDAMHTDMGTLLTGALGMKSAFGHSDFYFNGGARQPGCDDGTNTMADAVDGTPACSHQRVLDYYTETIKNPNALMGYKCSDYKAYSLGKCTSCSNGQCAYSGYNAQKESTGIFHLATRMDSPFTGRTIFVEIRLCKTQMSTTGKVYLQLIDQSTNTFDTTDVIYKTTTLTKSMVINIPVAVSPNLQNIDAGSISFSEESVGLSLLKIGSKKPASICIQSIILLDSVTKNMICYDGGIDIPSNQRASITFKDCN